MASIVELNQMSNDKLEKTLEEAREEIFNLRFHKASARLENTAQRLKGKEWQANARYIYEDSAWQVEFNDKGGSKLATAWVNLNKAQSKGRAAKKSNMIVRHEVAR